ncbi:DUF1850 domain-containing protein [Natronomonas salina]|uniref:DUF1850 domain-containing protein n=1 Tax=Natronomonas salina TaxID=1710540 RepID=UPI0015B46565|nr:DUF1850 domain-containing protein [Natronomonas salina]QLD89963.1 DUF1850 domain-containing protein [Natronomonas salina]
MTRRAWLVIAVVIVCAGVLTTGAVTVAATETVLVVTDDEGEELLVTPVAEDDEIIVEYTHSVEKTLVRDVYVAEDGQLVMTRMEFSSYGAGLPSTVNVTEVDGRYVYYPPERGYDPLRVTTGHVADHDLVVGDERYDIAEIADGGTVELRIETRFRL